MVITYHSLEDRVVKNFMRTGNFEGEEKKDFYGNLITPFRIINKKGTVPDETEIEDNKRARSARLQNCRKDLKMAEPKEGKPKQGKTWQFHEGTDERDYILRCDYSQEPVVS